jgi:hypothetical protein
VVVVVVVVVLLVVLSTDAPLPTPAITVRILLVAFGGSTYSHLFCCHDNIFLFYGMLCKVGPNNV